LRRNPLEIRAECAGAELRAGLERAAERHDAGRHPLGGRQAVAKMRNWGLIPQEAKDRKIQYSNHNARCEEFRTNFPSRHLDTPPTLPRRYQ